MTNTLKIINTKEGKVKFEIGLAEPEERTAVSELLERSGLPLDGLSDHWETALVARDGTRVIGSAALELYGRAALLRSVAVDRQLRGQGLGQHLTKSALGLAKDRGVLRVYLLTETAVDFFARFGFRPIRRSEVAVEVQRSLEFTHACPESAQAMVLQLSKHKIR